MASETQSETQTVTISTLPNWHQEIVALHQFFQDWFRADLPQSEAAFHRFTAVLHPQFNMVVPNGQLITRQQAIDGVFNGHGKSPHIKIWIEEAKLHHHIEIESSRLLIATYHELQSNQAGTTRRISTVTFQPDPAQPNQLTWLHVHETWVE